MEIRLKYMFIDDVIMINMKVKLPVRRWPRTSPTNGIVPARSRRNVLPHVDVYDPFCGSGTTLIACEITGRKAFCCELNPAYVDVIIRRWQEFSGGEATCEGYSFGDRTIAAGG